MDRGRAASRRGPFLMGSSRHVDEEECGGACGGQQEQHERIAERLHFGLLEGRVERNRSRYRAGDGQVEQRVAERSHPAGTCLGEPRSCGNSELGLV
jgi:hypothetical protein